MGEEKLQINGDTDAFKTKRKHPNDEEETLYALLLGLSATIFYPEPNTAASTPLLQRIKVYVSENGAQFHEASIKTGRKILQWTREGSPLRALLVIAVGTITLLAMTGLLVFMLFFLAATFNAIVISLLVSLAVAGGFLAIFFACVTAVYIGALAVAVFVISTATISAITASLIVTGWIGFFWTLWLATKKSASLAKKSVSMTGSALSAYSFSPHSCHPEPKIVID